MKISTHIKLTEREVALIAEADRDYPPTSKRTRLYSLVRNRPTRNWDIAFILVAVRHFGGVRQMKVVAVSSVDGKRTTFSGECNIVYGSCFIGSHLRVGWRKADLTAEGRQRKYAEYSSLYWYTGDERAWTVRDIGKDGKDNTRYWVLWHIPLNWDAAIAENPRFRYNSWRGGCAPLEWLRRYGVEPAIENFAKMGLAKLASVDFVRKVRADKGLFRYIRENMDGIASAWWMKPNAVLHAYRHGLTVEGERDYQHERRDLTAFKKQMPKDLLPKKFDYRAAMKFVNRAHVSEWEYSRYLCYCAEAEADLLSPQTASPPNIERRLADFDRASKRRQRREAAKRNDILRSLAERYARSISRLRLGGYCAVFPTAAADFVREGSRMGNCIGGGNYTMRHADGDCVCVFIRKADAPDKPFVDVEIVGGRVRQCYAKGNQNAPDEVRKIAKKIAKSIFKKTEATERKAA